MSCAFKGHTLFCPVFGKHSCWLHYPSHGYLQVLALPITLQLTAPVNVFAVAKLSS